MIRRDMQPEIIFLRNLRKSYKFSLLWRLVEVWYEYDVVFGIILQRRLLFVDIFLCYLKKGTILVEKNLLSPKIIPFKNSP